MNMVKLVFDEMGKNRDMQICADVFVSEDLHDKNVFYYERCVVHEVNWADVSFVRELSENEYAREIEQVRPGWLDTATEWLDLWIWQNLDEVENKIRESS